MSTTPIAHLPRRPANRRSGAGRYGMRALD